MKRPARQYAPASDLAVISCYFNPEQYASRRRNLDRFLQPILRGGAECRIVECVFGDGAWALAPASWVHRVRARDVMWQKERLLNLALRLLPPRVTKVAWIDCDVLFLNAD